MSTDPGIDALVQAGRYPERDLLTARDLQERYGLAPDTARSLMRAIGRDGGLVRIAGLRRVFVDRADVERRIRQSGGSA